MASREPSPRTNRALLASAVVVSALVTFGLAALLTDIFKHRQEAKNPYLRFVEVTEETTDPAPWGINWPREYDTYLKTAITTRTRFGGHGGSEALPVAKAERDPWLVRFYAGYAFSIDYRERRGHAYMLADQQLTRRVTGFPQPGSCLHCHASVIPTYRRIGDGDVFKGFDLVSRMTYQDAYDEVAKTGSMNPVIVGTTQEMQHVPGPHPVSCVDCHDPKTMELRVTRPAFLTGIREYMAHRGRPDFDPNRDATRQEMRSYVCGQCHVEYYCGPKTIILYPWSQGLRVEEIEAFYESYRFPDGEPFYDWTHAETGARVYKAQHPEFELYNQGIHARAGVACADCHMPYERQGAMKVSDHWVRSPLLNIARACQVCHPISEEALRNRVDAIQSRNFGLLERGGRAVIDYLNAMRALRAPVDAKYRDEAKKIAETKIASKEGASEWSPEERKKELDLATEQALNEHWAERVAKDEKLLAIGELQRKGQWRLDFVSSENSMGFHAPQEAARILGEAIDYFRQAEAETIRYRTGSSAPPLPKPQIPPEQPVTRPLDPGQFTK